MCVFCSIIEGSIPSYKVYEDDGFLAILDICQTTYGHTLVMPKKHYENILEMPEDEAKELLSLTRKLADKIVKNLDAKGFNLLVNTGEVAGQSVPHVHFHIIPRYSENDTVKLEFTENKYDFLEITSKINKAV